MSRARLLALSLLTTAVLGAPAAADAKPRLSLSVPTTTTKPFVKFKTVAKKVNRSASVEIQVFRNGFWAFLQTAERGTTRGTFKLKGGLQRTRVRVAVRTGSRFIAGASKPITISYFGSVSFRTLFANNPRLTGAGLRRTAIFDPVDVPAERSSCTRLTFTDLVLASVAPGEQGTLTVKQAGRADQTITVNTGDPAATLDVRLTPDRPYRIEPTTAPQPTQGERSTLRFNGVGRCFDDSPLVTP